MEILSRRRKYTYDEFCAAAPGKIKADLIDGAVYIAPPENTDANGIQLWLSAVLNAYLSQRELGQLYATRVAYYLDEYNAPEPDLSVLLASRSHLVRPARVEGRPDAVFEIVSTGTLKHDYVRKRELYQKYRVPEYWLIDELDREMTLLRLDAEGNYREVAPRQDVLRSRVIKGFWLKTEWLLKELPNPLDKLHEILGISKETK